MRISDWSSDVCSSDLPISITFLHAMRIDRPAFIATISVFFVAMSAMQIPLLVVCGVLTPLRLLLSVAAVLPLAAGMPLGALLARCFPQDFFDRLSFLVVLLAQARYRFSQVFLETSSTSH